MRNKIEHLETMRGMACILLVLFHTIGSYSSNGLQLSDDHALRTFNNLLQDLRMPIFSFISGFVFLVSVAEIRDVCLACGKKIRRLYIPMITCGAILFFLKQLVGVDDREFITLFYKSYDHLWYLQATIVLMFSHIFFVFLTKMDDVAAAVILGAVGAVSYVFYYDGITDTMSINGASYLAPYFFSGYVVSHRYAQWATAAAPEGSNVRNWGKLAMAGFILLAVQYPLKTDMLGLHEDVYRAIRIIIGVLACSTFLVFRASNNSLIWLGGKSYPIYLYHTIFAAAAREIIITIDRGISPYILVAPVLTAGLLGPILVERIAMRWPLSALLLLGVRKQPSRKAALATVAS